MFYSQFARITRIKTEELKQAEKRQAEQAKAKQDALTAAKSNLPKLNIIDDKTEVKAQII